VGRGNIGKKASGIAEEGRGGSLAGKERVEGRIIKGDGQRRKKSEQGKTPV